MADDSDLLPRAIMNELEADAAVADGLRLQRLAAYERALEDNKLWATPPANKHPITVATRQHGKDMINRVTRGGSFDPATRTYRLADGAKLTEDELARLPTQQLNSIALRVDAILGGPTPRPPLPFNTVLPNVASYLTDHTTVRWIESGRFTYVALWVKATSTWYVTGTGVHYGGNELTHSSLLGILARSSVTDVQVADDWRSVE